MWTDYTMGGNGVKCVCDSAAAGDPEMEGAVVIIVGGCDEIWYLR